MLEEADILKQDEELGDVLKKQKHCPLVKGKWQEKKKKKKKRNYEQGMEKDGNSVAWVT